MPEKEGSSHKVTLFCKFINCDTNTDNENDYTEIWAQTWSYRLIRPMVNNKFHGLQKKQLCL